MAKASELRSLDDAKLREQLKLHYEELFNLRFQKATSSLTNTARPRQVRKEIARIKTILRERELEREMNHERG
ncbi:MAG: 50S ribosomal protein L29 [Oscillochloridaceae bacterium]|nr:50S ribosomal protein L29 [Chloroflexaceae bacterium]MDW8392121.1 50S ribosomal protein L29 [Oscillochloridaceae bacterium]